MKQIVTDAIKATQKAEAEIENALANLNLARNVNGYGVYRERMPVGQLLAAASDAVAKAMKAISDLQAWPGPADYDAEEDENV